jgi:dGTPase
MAVDACERAPYASDPTASRGRLHEDSPSPSRNVFRRDCDRIIHSTAFRRLQFKTQVFVFHEGDHYRTRLTHTLEVTQIARALARALGLDEDLAEALALAHDLGHPPFGHAGERALHRCLEGDGGFDHNAQTLRSVTLIERRYPRFDGLNLTWETLEGVVKHNGPLLDQEGQPTRRYRDHGVPGAILDYSARHDLWLWSEPGPEAQVAAIADDIAYGAHDIDDGLRADLFSREDLLEIPLMADIVRQIADKHPGLESARRNAAMLRRLITLMIEDVLAESKRRLAKSAPPSADAVRTAGEVLIGFSPAFGDADHAIKRFLYARMYRHARIMRIMRSAEAVVRDLFAFYSERPAGMPVEWGQELDAADVRTRRRRVADFIAGMTDRYALIEHAKHFGSTPERL